MVKEDPRHVRSAEGDAVDFLRGQGGGGGVQNAPGGHLMRVNGERPRGSSSKQFLKEAPRLHITWQRSVGLRVRGSSSRKDHTDEE